MLELYEFSAACLPVDDKYAVNFLITGLFKFDRK